MAPRALASQPLFLPTTREELGRQGWDGLDVLLLVGDAYVDHPSFGAALLGRWLVSHGLRAGIVAQPRWDTLDDVTRMGRPGLWVGISAGAMDSMVANHTAFRARRRVDAYTPGGRPGARPDRACLVYANLARRAFPGVPLVLGGVEASLRRVTHYDFWSDSLRRSLLLDSKADLLVYGMAERAVLEISRRLRAGEALDGIRGTAFAGRPGEIPEGAAVVELPSHERILDDPPELMSATLALERLVHQGTAWAVQRSGARTVILAPPPAPLSEGEMDALYALPFTRAAHPSHREPIPAAGMVHASITSHRGCGGGCSFCSLALHQGRTIVSRSGASIRTEVETLTARPGWTGGLSDVGGPTANMWGAACEGERETCGRASCLWPSPCEHFHARQQELARLLRSLRGIVGVKHVRVASGVRHDLALEDPTYARALVGEFVGGQLKLAPEHVVDRVLRLMRKPSASSFERFLALFERESLRADKEQYVVPYLLSAFPGCTDEEMRELARFLERRGWRPQQVQCFIPTPGTVATAMFHAGVDTRGRPIEVARSDAARLRQHRILAPARGGRGGEDRGVARGPTQRREGGRVRRGDGGPRRTSRDRRPRPARTARAVAGSRPRSPRGADRRPSRS